MLANDEGALLWELASSSSNPTRVPLVIEDKRWSDYVFWLSYVAGELSALEVRRNEAAAPLSAQLLQRVPLGALDSAAKRCVDDFLQEWYRINPQTLLNLFPSQLDSLDEVADKSAGRERDERDGLLCKRYLELEGESDWRYTLAHEFDLSLSSVPTIIARARRRRFLTQVPRGRYGGQLTPKSLRLLSPSEREGAWEKLMQEQRDRIPPDEPDEVQFIPESEMTPEQLEIAKDMQRKSEEEQS